MCWEKEDIRPLLSVRNEKSLQDQLLIKTALHLRLHVKVLQNPCFQVCIPLKWHQNSFALSTMWCLRLGKAAPGTARGGLLSVF